jgi:Ankyrin repeats (3 copies)
LEASYSRNVLRISESDVPFAYRALLWLTYALFPLKLTALAEAAILEPNTTAVDDESRLSDPTDILDICGMLASYNDLSDEIQLSHHSVREFLSNNCKIPFSFPEKQSHQTIAGCCISYLLNSDFQAGAMASPQLLRLAFAKYPLLAYAARTWPEHVLRSGAEEALQPLILKLLTPEPTPHFYFWLQVILYYSSHGFEVPGTRPDYNPTPLYYASSYGLYYTVKSLIASGAGLNVRAGQYGGTAYHAACWRQRPQIGKLLLEAGIDTTIEDNNGMTAFDLIDSRFEDVAKVAVQHYQGVTLNPVVDSALRAMYSDRQARDSKEKRLREFNASTSSKVIGAKWRKPNRHLPRNSRELKDGEALELE